MYIHRCRCKDILFYHLQQVYKPKQCNSMTALFLNLKYYLIQFTDRQKI